MKGSNLLKLNEETMVEAVQEYLTKRMGATYVPKVVSVKPDMNTTTYNPCQAFLVQLEEKSPAPEAKP